MEKKKKSKKKELNPIIEDYTDSKKYNLEELKKEIKIIKKDSKNDTDSFYKNVVDKLMNEENIELKTEYANINENFAGVRLGFFAKFYNMPYLLDFLDIFERKRISLDRKSRKELVMTLENREREMRLEQQKQLQTMFGYGG